MELTEYLEKYMRMDRMDVYRREPVKDEDGFDSFDEPKLIYSNITCHLGKSKGMAQTMVQTDRAFAITNILSVYASNIYDINPNDILVIRKKNNEYRFIAGERIKYDTHQEINVNRDGEVGNDGI